LFSAVSGQAYRFKNYGSENNLPGEVIYTINQDQNGYLWLGTTEGLSRFDGFEFFKVQFPDSIAGRYPTVCLKDKKGKLWFGCNDGTLYYSAGRDLKQVTLPNSSGTAISTLFEGPDDFIYIMAQRKPVFRVNPDKPSEIVTISMSTDPNMFSACFSPAGNFLIGTQENLMICKVEDDSIIVKSTVEGFDYASIRSVNQLTDSEEFIIGTDGSGIFKLTISEGNNNLSRFNGYPLLESLTVRSVTHDPGGNFWVSASGTGVIKMQFLSNSDSLISVSLLNTESGLAGVNANLVYRDSGGNIWVGFNGDGLSMLHTDSFEFNTPGINGNPNNIIFTGKLRGNYILGTPSGFYVYDLLNRKAESFTPFSKQAGRNEISSYYIDNENNLWIGTRGSGLYVRNEAGLISQFYRSGDSSAIT
jgi:ligand-binding sensor domain-containing protein